MSLIAKTVDDLTTLSRASGATYINASGVMVGVDFATTTAQSASTGSKSFNVGSGRGWSAGMPLRITPSDATANILMVGAVTSYDAATGTLVVNITSVGSDTTTTKASWRLGYAGKRLDHSLNYDFNAGNARRGYLVESDARTNGVPNGDFVGSTAGVIGSGGALPTTWTQETAGGVTWTVVGSGITSAGQRYLDIRFSGTPTGTSIRMTSSNTAAVAASGDLWIGSFWAAIVGGSLANAAPKIQINERFSGGTAISNISAAISLSSALKRFSIAKNLTNYQTARTSISLLLTVTTSVAIDLTVRIACAQVEKVRSSLLTGICPSGGTSNSIVLSSSASSVDGAYVGLSILTTGGTGAGQTGVISGYVGATKTATISTTWSTVPDATTTYSIYSTDTSAAASSYIPTQGVIETRQSDLLDVASFSSWYGATTEGTLEIEVVTPSGCDVLSSEKSVFASLVQDASNFIRLQRAPAGLASSAQIRCLGNDQGLMTGSSFSHGSQARLAVAYKANDLAFSFNGAAVVSDSTTPDGLPVPTALRLGRMSDSPPSGAFMGWIRRVRFIPRRISNADLQLLA